MEHFCRDCGELVTDRQWQAHHRAHKAHRPGAWQRSKMRGRVLVRDNHRCVSCGRTAAQTGSRLELHHIDGDTSNVTDDSRVEMRCYECHHRKHDELERLPDDRTDAVVRRRGIRGFFRLA